jgi:polar amino acid transport system substrate-binding protein
MRSGDEKRETRLRGAKGMKSKAAGALAFAFAFAFVLAAIIGPAVTGLLAQQYESYAPGLWRGEVVRPRPDIGDLKSLRIYTEADYPPFNYYDEDGTLTGFNVELIQAMCDALGVRCAIEVKDWELLLPSLASKKADIVAASIKISEESLKSADFTDRYYDTPARFISRKGVELPDIIPEALAGRKIGVVKDSAHHAFLRHYYVNSKITPFKSREEMQKALIEKKIDLLLDDGVTSVFWLNGASSKACCAFRGGPLMDRRYFGDGVGFAVRRGDRRLRELLNYALEKVRRDGVFEELFLRYFPISFY